MSHILFVEGIETGYGWLCCCQKWWKWCVRQEKIISYFRSFILIKSAFWRNNVLFLQYITCSLYNLYSFSFLIFMSVCNHITISYFSLSPLSLFLLGLKSVVITNKKVKYIWNLRRYKVVYIHSMYVSNGARMEITRFPWKERSVLRREHLFHVTFFEKEISRNKSNRPFWSKKERIEVHTKKVELKGRVKRE